ncbi:sialate O-acetylesterase [Gayadomonas joobiniege]|uniref:sialate O-acetylesterase n=1 Tax=Gayadomonas joobiniege TaxID=1234606 RepID=UPI0003785EDC|nr:sialate O-acetylesterase [Gayadomonas joobiniege]
MKAIFSAVFILLVAACSSTSEPSNSVQQSNSQKHLFILAGQSNMSQLDLTKSFKPQLNKEFGANNIIIVKDAERGLSISRLDKNYRLPNGKTPKLVGDVFERLTKKVDKAIKGKNIASVTFILMQGERDAKLQLASVYGESLKRVIADLKTKYQQPNMNVVLGRINDFDLANKNYKHWSKIRAAQVKVASELNNIYWIDTDDLNNRYDQKTQQQVNGLNMTKQGFVELGFRFAEAATALIKQTQS